MTCFLTEPERNFHDLQLLFSGPIIKDISFHFLVLIGTNSLKNVRLWNTLPNFKEFVFFSLLDVRSTPVEF